MRMQISPDRLQLLQPEVIRSPSFTKDALVAERNRLSIPLVDMHRHVEGVLSAQELKDVALSIHADFAQLPWDKIEQKMGTSFEPNLNNFIQKLSTRWIRVVLAHGLLSENMHLTADKILQPIFAKILDKAYQEGIRELDMLASPLALCSEGNFTLSTIKADMDAVGMGTTDLEEKFEALKRREVNVIPTMHQYGEIFRQSVEEDRRFMWEGTGEEVGRKMAVGLRFCIRRDRDIEQVLKNDGNNKLSVEGKHLADEIRRMYEDKLIDGFDIAGDETNPAHPLRSFSAFIEHMKGDNSPVPFTVHAGELPPGKNDSLAYDNLEYAIQCGALRIGHAVRLFDNNERARTLLSEAIKRNIYFEVNVISNQWTDTAHYIWLHPIMRALRRKHLLFLDNKDGDANYEWLRTHIIVCDDDPVVANKDKDAVDRNPLMSDIARVAEGADNMGFLTEEEYLTFLWENGKSAPLWLLLPRISSTDT